MEKFTDNIGAQVNAMKKMLDSFNDFARSPQTILQKIDLVKEITIFQVYMFHPKT